MAAKQTPESFWSRVCKTDGCWLWTGATNTSGYGCTGWHGRVYTAHRVAAWLLGLVEHPSAPKDKTDPTHVLHRCDNRRCCNPTHLFLGTYADNMQDMYRKRRHPIYRGHHHANSKLRPYQVRLIRKQYVGGVSLAALARKYGVHERCVSNIVCRRTYAVV